jgi:hypothetical protein
MATWPNSNASLGKFTKHSSGNIDSVGSPGHASTLQATDRETILIRTGVIIVSIVLLIVITIVWPS